ncbi:toll-like receptor 4 [Haliotis rubra]|uniref:toll-like receptor 4 n=1 Tax=Haliotis rubra TaxID=36100 RepID=UPI001EE5D11D|nr:toll-like receptor 4 [Haliotis rubra]
MAEWPDDVFLPLQKLQKLHLHNNDRRFNGTYPETALGKLRSVVELKIDSSRITIFGSGFANMSSLKRLLLGFNGCKIEEMSNITLRSFQHSHVEDLDLSSCPLEAVDKISFVYLKRLKNLNLSKSTFVAPVDAVRSMYGLNGLNMTSVSFDTMYSFLPTFSLTLPPKLEYLCMHGTLYAVGYINGNIEFKNAASLKSLNFEFNGLYALQYNIYGLENLTEIDVSGNYFTNVNPGILKYFTSLTTLKMSQMGFRNDFLLKEGREMFLPLGALKTIVLSRNDLAVMDSQIFAWNQLTVIDLSLNRFESIPFDITTTPSLQRLDLSYNSLPVLSASQRSLLDALATTNNLTLNLNNNLLSCGCKNLDFVKWLFQTDVNVESIDTYTCVSDDGVITSPSSIYHHYDETWRRCLGPIWLSISISAFALIILFMILIYLIYQKKTLVLNIIHRLFGLVNVSKSPKRTDFPNDAYIGYSDVDYQYVCHTVREHLEDRHGVKLFLKDRDTIPGGQIADDIISGIDSSWKTVLVLTQSFIEDQWCRFIVNRIVYSSTRMPAGCILLVLFEDVRRGDISPALLNVVEERHIFSVGKYMGDQGRLWRDKKTLVLNIIHRLFGLVNVSKSPKRTDFPNDAYIGYSDVDYQYICHTVREHLEDRHGVKLFLKDRDTIPGGQIADDIISGIDSSWKTVLVLTQSFIEDQWCRFIVNRIVYSSTRMPAGSILLVLFEDVRRGDISPALLNVVEERHIFSVGKCMGDQGRLWRDVSQLIKNETEF